MPGSLARHRAHVHVHPHPATRSRLARRGRQSGPAQILDADNQTFIKQFGGIALTSLFSSKGSPTCTFGRFDCFGSRHRR